ncbi:MAG: ribonuclease PH [Anaerolineaceae bacterium]|nr:ribonuclease PH [Anaerolineaceae bacterium]
MTRIDGRKNNELRPVKFEVDYVEYPEGSVLVSFGKTKVLCNVTIEEGVPKWMAGAGKGWLTAEYAMLPRATQERTRRETTGPGARSQEIKRLIGRSLRMAVDLDKLGERTIVLDCDVIQADGGTRTAAITGGYTATALALLRLQKAGALDELPINSPIAAISVGIIDQEAMLDLCYVEDSRAEVDMNVVMNANGEFIELQGTGEHSGFSRSQLNDLLTLAEDGIQLLLQKQRDVLDDILRK